MRSSKTIHVISAHAEGEVGDVIVGGVFRHVNLLVPPKHPEAIAAWIIMEPEDTPPMSGSNAICVATVLLDGGLVPMQESETRMELEAPGGLVRARADCQGGKAQRIFAENLPSFSDKLAVPLEVEGLGTITVDTAYGGDSFVVVDAAALGFEIVEAEAKEIARLGVRITDAANAQLGFSHPENPEWDHISFCAFCGPLTPTETGFTGTSAVAIQPGKVDRSPTGTAVSARMALMAVRGQLQPGQSFGAVSIIGSRFTGHILGTTTVGDRPAIRPEISGRGWITGVHQHMLDPDDPWPGGYRLSDTWGA